LKQSGWIGPAASSGPRRSRRSRCSRRSRPRSRRSSCLCARAPRSSRWGHIASHFHPRYLVGYLTWRPSHDTTGFLTC
jgi:hypothetical protein